MQRVHQSNRRISEEEKVVMELSRLLEITNDRERCEFCINADNDETCLSCDKVKPITAEELRHDDGEGATMSGSKRSEEEGC